MNELGLTRIGTQTVRLCDLIFELFNGLELAYQESLRGFKRRPVEIEPAHLLKDLLKEAREINRRLARGHQLPEYSTWPHRHETDFVQLVSTHLSVLNDISEENYAELKKVRMKCRKMATVYFNYAYNTRAEGKYFVEIGYM
jgi:hypothetical protein